MANYEALLISSLVNNPDDMRIVLGAGIDKAMFRVHTEVWGWIDTFITRFSKAPSAVALKQKFPEFRVIGDATDTEHFCEEVRSAHATRLLVEMMRDVGDSIAQGHVDTAVQKTNSAIVRVAQSVGVQPDTDVFDDYADVYLEVAERVQKNLEGGIVGISTGMPPLDDEIGGYDKKQLIVVTARLGSGKSFFIQYGAAHAALSGKKCLFLAIEQSRAQVQMRLHSILSGPIAGKHFSNKALMKGMVNIDEYRDFLEKLSRTMNERHGNMIVRDITRGGFSTHSIRAQIEMYKPDIVFVDYLQLMDMPTEDHIGISYVTKQLKQMSVQYDIPIVAAAQLNRQATAVGFDPEDPPDPRATVAGGDSIGRDADVMISQQLVKGTRRVMVQKLYKNRNGEDGRKWYIHYEPGLGIIKPITYHESRKLKDEDEEYFRQQIGLDDEL